MSSINIPDKVTSIGSSAFSECSSLKEIVLPYSVNKINTRLFYGCSSLEKVVLHQVYFYNDDSKSRIFGG